MAFGAPGAGAHSDLPVADSMTHAPRIAIVGAGPGGLTLACMLQQVGLCFMLFELDGHAQARQQGGTLDLDQEMGQLALQRTGLMTAFRRRARYEDQETRLFDKTGKLLFEDCGAPSDERPEIDRAQLRELLLEGLPEASIRWNHKLREVLPRADGKYDLVFDKGVWDGFDLVVGADGTWSRVRPLVSSYSPQYTGVTFIEFGIDDADRRHPILARVVGHGTMSVLGDGMGLFAQRNADAHLRVYATFRAPKDWASSTFDFSRPASVLTELKAQFIGWAPLWHALIDAGNDQLQARRIFALPVGHHWPHRPGITLLGDAAHVMSPYGGNGVNIAMLDAAELGRRLTEQADWSAAVQAYERDMFERTRPYALFAAEGVAIALSPAYMKHEIEALERRRARRAEPSTPA